MEWENYFKEAIDYCSVAQNASHKGKLGNIVIYNVISIVSRELYDQPVDPGR